MKKEVFIKIKDINIKIHDVINIIITILDARDPYTYTHSERVAELSVRIAEDMGLLPDHIEKIHIAAHLHDVGKIGVPDTVLNKPGKLNDVDMIQIQSHSRIGYNILRELAPFQEISDIVLHHHERYDGRGYPDGIKGEDIPIESRIIAVADSFDAITSDRPYRNGLSYEVGFDEINKHNGDQFCPLIVEHFNNILNDIPPLINKCNDSIIQHSAFVGHEELLHSRKIIMPNIVY